MLLSQRSELSASNPVRRCGRLRISGAGELWGRNSAAGGCLVSKLMAEFLNLGGLLNCQSPFSHLHQYQLNDACLATRKLSFLIDWGGVECHGSFDDAKAEFCARHTIDDLMRLQ